MKIKEKFIDSVLSGQKTHEYRLNDNDRRQIKCNDRIILVSRSNSAKYINVRVTKIETYKSWKEALESYWEKDFKDIFDDLDIAIKECNRFYNSEDVEKFGIVVFSIVPMKYVLKESRVLLDTNVIIERESIVSENDNLANKVMLSLKHLKELGCNLFYLRDSVNEISSYKDIRIRNSVLNKLNNGYDELNELNDESDNFFKNSLKDFNNNENSLIDNKFLLQLYNDRCDYLYTDDFGILSKAKKLYLEDRIITTDKIIAKINETNGLFKEYKSSFINLVRFKDINLNDVFFDSLKEDYIGFENWFKKKANEQCYLYEKNDGIKGFLYLKVESEKEKYDDFEKPFTIKKKRLKVGTFKIVSTGLRLGERFVQIIVDTCLKLKLDEIYVTLFEDKRDEVKNLKSLLESWGFEKYTHKKNGELVLVKRINAFDNKKSVKENYPLNRENPNYYFLPIRPFFHTNLFPDLKLKFENNLDKEMACNYALEKKYITKFNQMIEYKVGDVVLIYRMGEENRTKKYSSCVTGIAVLQEFKICNTINEMMSLVKNKSVFNESQINELFNSNFRTVISLIYIKPLKSKVILKTLYEKGIVEPGKGPRILQKISESEYNEIIEESEL